MPATAGADERRYIVGVNIDCFPLMSPTSRPSSRAHTGIYSDHVDDGNDYGDRNSNCDDDSNGDIQSANINLFALDVPDL
jgi:hypothetical protein